MHKICFCLHRVFFYLCANNDSFFDYFVVSIYLSGLGQEPSVNSIKNIMDKVYNHARNAGQGW